MANIITLTSRLFNEIFVGSGKALPRILYWILNSPYLLIGACFVIIGFTVSVITRIIRS